MFLEWSEYRVLQDEEPHVHVEGEDDCTLVRRVEGSHYDDGPGDGEEHDQVDGAELEPSEDNPPGDTEVDGGVQTRMSVTEHGHHCREMAETGQEVNHAYHPIQPVGETVGE